MNSAGEKKPSSLWNRLRGAAGAVDTPATQPTTPAPTPSAPTTPPPPDVPEPPRMTAEPPTPPDVSQAPTTPLDQKTLGNMSSLVDQINDKVRLAKLIIEHKEVESDQASKALDALQLKMEELERKGGDDDDWNKLVTGLKREQQKIEQWMDNVNAVQDLPKEGDAQHTPDDIAKIASGLVKVMTENVTVQADRARNLLIKAGKARHAPKDKSLTKALAPEQTQPVVSLTSKIDTRPKGSAHLPSGTLGTALHNAAEQTKDTGGVGVELGREIEAMQTRIDSRFVKIFSVMDQAVGRIVDNKAYAPGPDGESVVPLNDPNFKEQLKATMAAANDFAEIVKVLPQEVMDLIVELADTERNFLAKLKREPSPPPTVPPAVPPFDPAVAPTSVATSAIKLSQIDVGKEPPLDVGKREAGRALGGALTTLEAIENLKTRIDAQIIHILNTINEVMSRALDGEAYTDAGGISAVTDDPNPVNRLETTVRVASDLTDILARLPQEVTTLVSEIHDAEKQIVDAFDVYQAKPSQ